MPSPLPGAHGITVPETDSTLARPSTCTGASSWSIAIPKAKSSWTLWNFGIPTEQSQRRPRKTRSSTDSRSWPQRWLTRRRQRPSPNSRPSHNFATSSRSGIDWASQEQCAKHGRYHILQGWCRSNLQGWHRPCSSSFEHRPLL